MLLLAVVGIVLHRIFQIRHIYLVFYDSLPFPHRNILGNMRILFFYSETACLFRRGTYRFFLMGIFLLFEKQMDGHLVDDGAQQGDFIVTLQFHAPSKALLLNLLNFLRQILHIPEWSRSCIMASTTASTTKLITRETQAAFRKYAVRRFWNEEDSFL